MLAGLLGKAHTRQVLWTSVAGPCTTGWSLWTLPLWIGRDKHQIIGAVFSGQLVFVLGRLESRIKVASWGLGNSPLAGYETKEGANSPRCELIP